MESKLEYPLITIGMPTYNGNMGLVRALNSVFQQNYPNLEIIISDNGSTDNTGELCEEIARTHPEVKYVRQEQNLGILRNFEFVLKKATGKYFMWVSDDDTIEPGVLFKYVDFLERNPDHLLVTGIIRYWRGEKLDHFEEFTLENVKPNKRVVDYYSKVRWGAMYHGCMRREIAQRIPKSNIYGYDYHFVAAIVYLGKIKTLDFIGYNKHLGGTSGNWTKFATTLGEKKWVGTFPFVKIAMDAFSEVQKSPVFNDQQRLSRFYLGLSSFIVVIYNNYPKLYSEVAWKKLKRIFSGTAREYVGTKEQTTK